MNSCTQESNKKTVRKNPTPSPISRQLTGHLPYLGRGEDVCLQHDDGYEPQTGVGSNNFCLACLGEAKKRNVPVESEICSCGFTVNCQAKIKQHNCQLQSPQYCNQSKCMDPARWNDLFDCSCQVKSSRGGILGMGILHDCPTLMGEQLQHQRRS